MAEWKEREGSQRRARMRGPSSGERGRPCRRHLVCLGTWLRDQLHVVFEYKGEVEMKRSFHVVSEEGKQ